MTNLIERLRYEAPGPNHIACEAADTIERQAAEIERLNGENFALTTKLFARGYEVQLDDLRTQVKAQTDEIEWLKMGNEHIASGLDAAEEDVKRQAALLKQCKEALESSLPALEFMDSNYVGYEDKLTFAEKALAAIEEYEREN